MPINMTCPSCSKPLTAPESAVGRRAKCPGCAQVMIVPDVVFDAEMAGDLFGNIRSRRWAPSAPPLKPTPGCETRPHRTRPRPLRRRRTAAASCAGRVPSAVK